MRSVQVATYMRYRWAFVAVFTATSVGSRMAMVALPNVKPVAFLTAMGGIIGGGYAGFLVGFLTMLVSDALFFGVGLWTAATALSMGLLGLLSGVIWSGRVSIPSRWELGVTGYLLTLMYDLLTSIFDPRVLLPMIYNPSSAFAIMIFNVILGLFIPLGGVLYPAGPAHELTTALLLAFAGPTILKRCGSLRVMKNG